MTAHHVRATAAVGRREQKKISDIKRTELDKVKAEKKRREELKKLKEENRKKATIVQKVRLSHGTPQKAASVDGCRTSRVGWLGGKRRNTVESPQGKHEAPAQRQKVNCPVPFRV
jgi:hypothetical protein